MTDRSPIVAFGLQAATIALKAKAGHLTARDQLSLVESMFDWVDGDTAARDAVRNFMALAKINAPAAGERLQRWLEVWSADADCRSAESVLSDIEGERHGWQGRKDCGHG